jgi:hypothetical protein
VLLVAVMACATSHGQRLLQLDAGGCLGPCPSYTVAVYEDGYVEYRGIANVRRGRHTAQLRREQLASLEALFARSGFASLDMSTSVCDTTDLGNLYSITFRRRRIEFSELCDRVPSRVQWLLVELIAALGVEP